MDIFLKVHLVHWNGKQGKNAGKHPRQRFCLKPPTGAKPRDHPSPPVLFSAPDKRENKMTNVFGYVSILSHYHENISNISIHKYEFPCRKLRNCLNTFHHCFTTHYHHNYLELVFFKGSACDCRCDLVVVSPSPAAPVTAEGRRCQTW